MIYSPPGKNYAFAGERIVIRYSAKTGPFTVGETATGSDPYGSDGARVRIDSDSDPSGDSGVIEARSLLGQLLATPLPLLTGLTSGATAIVDSVSAHVGGRIGASGSPLVSGSTPDAGYDLLDLFDYDLGRGVQWTLSLRLTHNAPLGGPFLVGETITGGTSGTTATVDVAGYLEMLVVSVVGIGFSIDEIITGGTSGAMATLTGAGALDYQTFIDFTPSLEGPPMSANIVGIHGLRVPLQIFAQAGFGADAVVIQQDTSADFVTPTTLATISNFLPSGGGSWGHPFEYANLFTALSPYVSEPYVRVRFRSIFRCAFSVGNLWLGLGIDTVADEGWNFAGGFDWTDIDRSIRSTREDGGRNIVVKPPLRRFSGTGILDEASWHLFADAKRGALRSYIDSPAHPWLICLDPDDMMRAEIGRHAFSGLWELDAAALTDRNVFAPSGSAFVPNIALDLMEWR